MKLSIGIVGLPNVGKSTLFKALTKQNINIANYPFATIDPNVGVVAVPDERLDKLYEVSKLSFAKASEWRGKKIPAIVEFYDIAGLVKGANKGEGLGNQFLSHIREVNAIVHLVRCFKSDDIIHVENNVNPLRDIEIINSELILKDIDALERHLDKAESEARSGNKSAIAARDTLLSSREILNLGELLSAPQHSNILQNIRMFVPDFFLLSTKPQIYLLNGKREEISSELISKIKELDSTYIIADLNDPKTDLSSLIREAYKTLNLISFFTTGEDETRAWTIKRGSKAPQAAGAIHSDFEKKFIRAEIISWDKLLETGDWAKARQKGLIRLEGKEYVVQDGDVMVVRHG